jgi:hypothetical protein
MTGDHITGGEVALRTLRSWDRPRAASPPGGPDPAPLLGRWVNYDPGTTGILQVELRPSAGGVVIEASSVPAGEQVSWGEAAVNVFAGGVDSAEAVGFTARYEFGALSVLLAAYLNNRLLVLDAYSTFAPQGPRSPYFQRDHLYLR